MPQLRAPRQDHDESAPAVTLKLAKYGPSTGALETNLARSPLYASRAEDHPRPVQLSLLSGPLVVKGLDFHQTGGARLSFDDQHVVMRLCEVFGREGCPSTNILPLTLTDVCTAMGYTPHPDGGFSGAAYREAKKCLARIRSVTFSCKTPSEDFPDIWGIISNTRPARRGRPLKVLPDPTMGQGYVLIDPVLADLIRAEHVVYLNVRTWEQIAHRNTYAGRLWPLFEADTIGPDGWHYSFFSAPAGASALDQRRMPALADVLFISHWKNRRDAKKTIADALQVIAEEDDRYRFEILPGRSQGMWTARAFRGRPTASRTPAGDGRTALPDLVLGAWRQVYGSRRVSDKQEEYLGDLSRRRGDAWVASQLLLGGNDPFGAVLRQDRALTAAAARKEQEAIEENRRRERDLQLAFDRLAEESGDPDPTPQTLGSREPSELEQVLGADWPTRYPNLARRVGRSRENRNSGDGPAAPDQPQTVILATPTRTSGDGKP